MAGVTGLEPATSGVTSQRSNQAELHPHPNGQAAGVVPVRSRIAAE